MFGIRMLGSGREYYRKMKALDEAIAEHTPQVKEPKPAKLRFPYVLKANAEIERLEAELAKQTMKQPEPKAPPKSKPASQAPLPSWAECSRDLPGTKQKLSRRLDELSGCDFAAEILESTGLQGASLDAQCGALLATLWIAGPTVTPTSQTAVETLEGVRAAMAKETDPVKKSALARRAREMRGHGGLFKTVVVSALLALGCLSVPAQGLYYSGLQPTTYTGGTNKAVALSTNTLFMLDCPRANDAQMVVFCSYKFLNAPGAGDDNTIRIDFFRCIDPPPMCETNSSFNWLVNGNSTTAIGRLTNFNVGAVPYHWARVCNTSTNAHATNLTISFGYRR